MQEILPLAGIVVVLVLIAVLAFHVKKQRDNHVQLFVYMYGTILEGRLRNLIVCLEDMLDMPDGVETVSETVFSRVEWHRIADRSLCGEFVMLAEQNALGSRAKKTLEHGFDCLSRALAMMPDLPREREESVRFMRPADRQQWRKLLSESIRSFEAVRRNTVF